jgi:hypothetical protein
MSSYFIYLLLLIVQCKEQVPEVMRTRESIRACKIYTGKIFSNRRRTDKVSSASKVRCLLCHIHITFLYSSVSKKQVVDTQGEAEGSGGLEKETGTTSAPHTTFW